MANVTITQLPQAGPILGTESVPIVQNGQTVQTTTAAIAASPSQTQTFLTLNSEATLPNSRYLSTGTGLGLTDGGALSFYRISLNGASASLETALTGFVAKDSASSVVARTLQTSGAGLSVSDGNGVSGNPVFSLTGLVSSLANTSGPGVLCLPNNGSVILRTLTGTANQIDIVDGTGAAGSPTFSLASNPILPGTGAVTVPKGTTAQQPVGVDGQIRYNTDLSTFEGYSGGWQNLITPNVYPSAGIAVSTGSAWGTSKTSPSGDIVGTTDSQTLTNKIINGSSNSITNVSLTASVTGTLPVANGGTGLTTFAALSIPVANTLNTLSALTATAGQSIRINAGGTAWEAYSPSSGSGDVTGPASSVSGNIATFNGITGKVIQDSGKAVPAGTIVGTSDSQTLTNKTIDGSNNTITNVSLTTGVTGTLPIANGGSGQVTAQAAMNAFAGAVTSGQYLRGNGTNVVMSAIQAADVPTLNQNTTGTASNVTGIVAVANGGTGLSTTPVNGALDIGNGTGFTRATLTAGTGISITNGAGSISIASSVTPVTSVTGTSPVASSGGTTPAISLSSGYGDTQNPYASKTANFFLAAPNGSAGAPTFRAIVAADIPTLNQNTTGTASNVTGTVAVANGGTGLTTFAALSLPVANTLNTLTALTATAGQSIRINAGGTAWETYTPTSGGDVTGPASSVSGNIATFNGVTGKVIQDGGKALPSGAVVGTSDTQTVTNKTITARVNAQTTTASPWAWNSDSYDQQSFSALANALTINADAGTPTDGQRTILRFKDNGTPRALTWTTGSSKSFRAIGVTLPTTTVANKTTYVGCIYNTADSRWDVVAVTTEA